MIIDCVTYFQEADLLELRLRELDPLVDLFVVVEGGRTHAGAPRTGSAIPDDLRSKWHHKLITAVAELPAGDGLTWTWRREMMQRNAIGDVLARLGCAPDDMILVSDCDELPSRMFVSLLASLPDDGIAVAHQTLHYYTVNHRGSSGWRGTRATQYGNVRALGADGVRYAGRERGGYPRLYEVPDAGWHFSYFGGVRAIQAKMQSFLHQEFNLPEHTDATTIAERARTGQDVYGRPEQSFAIGPVDGRLPVAMYSDAGHWTRMFDADYAPDWKTSEPLPDADHVLALQRLVANMPGTEPLVVVGDRGGQLTIALAAVAGQRHTFVTDRYRGKQEQQTAHNIAAFGLRNVTVGDVPDVAACVVEWQPRLTPAAVAGLAPQLAPGGVWLASDGTIKDRT